MIVLNFFIIKTCCRVKCSLIKLRKITKLNKSATLIIHQQNVHFFEFSFNRAVKRLFCQQKNVPKKLKIKRVSSLNSIFNIIPIKLSSWKMERLTNWNYCNSNQAPITVLQHRRWISELRENFQNATNSWNCRYVVLGTSMKFYNRSAALMRTQFWYLLLFSVYRNGKRNHTYVHKEKEK